MSGELLLINPAPRKRAKRKSGTAKRKGSHLFSSTNQPGRKRARRKAKARSSNPVAVIARRRSARKANPVTARRRRNPIRLGASMAGVQRMLTDAAIGGAGAVVFDAMLAQVQPYLPASMSKTPGKVGVYEAYKVAATVALGIALSKLTKGYSRKLAAGSLIVQASDMLRTLVPDSVPLGYANPVRTINSSARVQPNARGNVGAYQAGGATPLLNAYQAGNVTPLLNGSRSSRGAVMQREGITAFP